MRRMRRAERILGLNYLFSTVAVFMVVYFTRSREVLYLVPGVLFVLASFLLIRGAVEDARLRARKEGGVSYPAEVIGMVWEPLYHVFQMRGFLFFRLVCEYTDGSGERRQVESSHYGVMKRRAWTERDASGLPRDISFEARVYADPRYPEEVSVEVMEKEREGKWR